MADAKEDLKEAVQDVLESRREFTVETPESETLYYYIGNPSGKDIRKADWQYSKIYNQAIVDGFLTQSQMLEVLQEKEIVNDEYTEKLETIRISLGAELFRLENLMEVSTPDEKEATALEVARLRDELFQLNQRVNGPMSNTCENLAEDARTDFLTSRIIQNKDNSNVWKDYDAYRDEENTALAIKSRFEVMLWMQGLESNFLENTLEQTTLREVAQTRLNSAVQAQAEELAAEESEESEKAEKAAVEDLELPVEDKEPSPKPKKKSPKKKSPGKKRGRPKGSKAKDEKPKQDE